MTPARFRLVHAGIVIAIPLAAWALAAWSRRRPASARRIRLALALAIAANTLVWYGYTLALGWVAPPAGLPLDLCDVVLWITVYALASARPWALEAAYYLGIAGSGMAVLTPDLGAPFPSFPAIQFFVTHGSVVAAILFLVFSGALRPRPGSWWRTVVGLNAYAAAVGAFDAASGANYMYLRQKPEAASLLDLLGPWPWYLLGGEAVALVLCWLLYLPFRPGAGGRARTPGPPPPRARGGGPAVRG